MNEQQENQLLILLSDFIPLMDGDIVQGISPEAKNITRHQVLEQLKADKELLDKKDTLLMSWQEENIELLQAISDDDFQAVVKEKIVLTEIQIGQSLFQPLSEKQLDYLAEQINPKRKTDSQKQLQADEKTTKKTSRLRQIFKQLR
ncbi:hypothetical protein [Streptococcus hyointestinalis]|uniref:hypothetical protein n=1 Tax=Streptococcus hyointestinalis TaxID=1337 RepID=UPI0013DFAC5A|nr:hypothetical protein [Streptococcus hyointestinalis]